MEPATAGSRMRESTYRFILLKTTTNVDLETRHIILEKVSEMVQSAAISLNKLIFFAILFLLSGQVVKASDYKLTLRKWREFEPHCQMSA